jgi:uncharacterized protein (DUF58 family)
MLTRRGFWLLFLVLTLLGMAVLRGQETVVVLALVALTWYGTQAAYFAVQLASVQRGLRTVRRIDGQPAHRVTLWTGRDVDVEVELIPSSPIRLACLRAVDLPPVLGVVQGAVEAEGPCSAKRPLRIQYRLKIATLGRVRFEGVRLELRDGQGLFAMERLVRAAQEHYVLPAPAPGRNLRAGLKWCNLLPAHGVHRHRRPGTGSELLDLRDYVPGDPPRTIAWKISARRDRLITKEYESEVPVRCSLFVDVSQSVRVGAPGRTALVQLIELSASIVQQVAALRDPVGMYLFSGEGADVVSPACGKRHVLRLFGRMGRAAAALAEASPCPTDLLLGPAMELCRRTYPDLLDRRRNRPNRWFAWLPRMTLPWYAYAGFLAVGSLFLVGLTLVDPATWRRAETPLLIMLLVFLSSLGMLARVVRNRESWVWRIADRGLRKQLAGVVAAVYQLGPGSISLLANDKRAFARQLQRLLIDHDVPYPRPLYDADGKYLFNDGKKLDVLRRLLLRAVAHGKDNELFVALVDLWEQEESWPQLLDTLKVVVARHHQVVVICPWPVGLPAPTSPSWPDEELVAADPLTRRYHDPATGMKYLDLVRFRRRYAELKNRLARLGIALICATASDSVRQVLARVEQIRAARIRR